MVQCWVFLLFGGGLFVAHDAGRAQDLTVVRTKETEEAEQYKTALCQALLLYQMQIGGASSPTVNLVQRLLSSRRGRLLAHRVRGA